MSRLGRLAAVLAAVAALTGGGGDALAGHLSRIDRGEPPEHRGVQVVAGQQLDGRGREGVR